MAARFFVVPIRQRRARRCSFVASRGFGGRYCRTCPFGGARTTPSAWLGIKNFLSLILTKNLELKKMYINSESDE